MKKILITIAAAFAAVTMNAQVFVGGSIGVGSFKVGGGDAETCYKFIPEVGYNLNDEWAIGLTLGYSKGTCSLINTQFDQDVTTELFQICPYARYTFLKTKYVNAFVDGGLGFGSFKDQGTLFSLGLKPGVAVNLTEALSFVTHVGFVGMQNFSPKGGGKSSTNVGVDVDNSNVSFGLYYNF